MSIERLSKAGVYEFIFGGDNSREAEYLTFWERLGFVAVEEGSLSSAQAGQMYAHDAELRSFRLKHPGCDSFGTGYVRLQLWSSLRNEGLANKSPVQTGSRWMGMYTHDILQLNDSFRAQSSQNRWKLWISKIINAPLEKPAPICSFEQAFVGLRELLIFGDDFRLAFIQRGGFDRPGFGTFDDTLPFKNTEGTHANIVQPANSFSTDFYKTVFDFEAAPYGEAHDSGEEQPTIEALALRSGERFRVERTRAQNCPSGLLQVYSSYMEGEDYRELSRPGCRNLSAYSVRVSDLDECRRRIEDAGGEVNTLPMQDEFKLPALSFVAPDGYHWLAIADVK